MRAHPVIRVALILLLCLGLVSLALAAGTATLEHWVLSGSVGQVSGAHVTIQQVLGQPLVGQSGSEHVSIRAGYAVAGTQALRIEVYLPLVVRNH